MIETVVGNAKWGVIVNPHAGTRKLRKDWIYIYRTLKFAEMQFSVQTTEYVGHAIELARRLVENGFRRILIIGGDGTVNEVVNGIYSSSIEDKSSVTIALVPYGTGNDYARYWGLYNKSRSQVAEILKLQNTVKVDVGCMQYIRDGVAHTQYFANGAGFGFDGLVVNITNRLKKFFGGHAFVYSLSVLLAVFRYRPVVMRIDADGFHLSQEVFSIAVGNGCFSGGGLKQTDGDPTDDKFFVTAIRRPSFKEIMTGLGYLFRGEIFNHPVASTVSTNRFSVTPLRSVNVETDGVEIETGDNVTYNFSLVHHGLNMVVNKDFRLHR